MAWLDSLLDDPRSTTVVCRTAATTAAVYRRLAARGAGARTGFRVTTLGGLLRDARPLSLDPPVCEDMAPLPTGHPWSALLGARPRLSRLLRQHVHRAHALRLGGASLAGLRPELQALVDAAWEAPDQLGERHLLSGGLPGRVVALGFAGDARFLGAVTVLELALLASLDAEPVDCGDPRAAKPGPLPCLTVADVHAEARLVVERAGPSTLVLVPDRSTAERLRAALARNGVPVADDGASPLRQHALVAVLDPLVPVFASGGLAPLSARDLARLLSTSVLAAGPPACGIEPVEGVDAPRASARQVREVVAACRRVQGTPAAWRDAIGELVRRQAADLEQAEQRTQRDRMQGLARRLAVSRVVLAKVATLVRLSSGGTTLGQLARFAHELGLSDPGGDRVGHAILRALSDHGHLEADEQAFEDALTGGVASGRVETGVQILRYEQYDGRPADQLLLTGVHDKGLGAPPGRDPFLRPGDYAALGLPTPLEAVRERFELVRWAASRAGQVQAFAPLTDGSGRSTAPVVGLDLDTSDVRAAQTYGLVAGVAETRDLGALVPGGAIRDARSVQVDLEWLRDGVGLEAPGEHTFDPDEDTLADFLEAHAGRLPDELRPWLGEAGSYPGRDDGLPVGFNLSASRLTAFTQCLYRAWLQSVLKLRAPDELEEELDARELGDAIHKALEHAVDGIRWAAPAAQVDAERGRLLKALVSHTDTEVRRISEERPVGLDTAALAVAREGLANRWKTHWEHYVTTRVTSAAEQNTRIGLALVDQLPAEPRQTLLAVLAAGFAKSPARNLSGNLHGLLAEERGRDRGQEVAEERLVAGLSGARTRDVRQRLPGVWPDLQRLLEQFRVLVTPSLLDESGDLEVVAPELAFGALRDDDPPLWLPLGRGRVSVRGYVDLVSRRKGVTPQSSYEVVDYKTGNTDPGSETQVLHTLVRPQLALYALVVDALGRLAPEHDDPARAEAVAYDQVRSRTFRRHTIGQAELPRIRDKLGGLLDQARDGSWPPAAHPDGCPVRGASNTYCDFASVCRMRKGFAPEEGP